MRLSSNQLSRLLFLIVAAYGVALSWTGVHLRFVPDDMMNLHEGWISGMWRTLWDSVAFWNLSIRPVGSLYYLSLFRLFGLNPLPYRIVALLFVVMNAYVSCLLAEQLTKSRRIGFLTGMLACAHSVMPSLFFADDVIYDILAYFFSLVTMLWYVRIRERGTRPSLMQSVGLICLCVAAFDSKEASAVLPGFVLAYEVLFHGLPRGIRWFTGEGRLPLILLLMSVVYATGKMSPANPMVAAEGYRVHISVARYVENNNHYLNELFYTSFFKGSARLATLYALAALTLFVLKQSPALRWSCFYVLTVTLPISVIPPRGGSSLYLPLFGWALTVSILGVKLVESVSAALPVPQWARATLVWVAVGALATQGVRMTLSQWSFQRAATLAAGERTWSVIEQITGSGFRPKQNSRVIFLDDPFEAWDTLFISRLVWNDPSVKIMLGQRVPEEMKPDRLATYQSVLTFENGQLKQIR